MQDNAFFFSQLAWAVAIFVALSGAPAGAEECASEQDLLKSFLAQPPQTQLHVVAGIQAEADLVVAPYMDNPALMIRQEQGIGPGNGFSTSVLGAEFVFDVAGKHRARKESAQIRAARHKFAVREQLLHGTCAVRRKILELEHMDHRLSVLDRFESSYEWLLETVVALAKGMEKSQFEVSRAAWRLETYREQIAELIAARSAIHSQLSTMAGCSVPEDLFSIMPDTLPELEELLARSEAEHPALAAARVIEQSMVADEAVADRTWLPDLGVYGAYRIDASEIGKEPMHGYELGLTMALPIFRKGDEARSRTRASTAAARLSLMRKRQAIRISIISSHAAALSRMDLLEKLSSQPSDDQKDVWNAAVRAYKEGVVVLGELVEMLQAEEARALARARIRFEARIALLTTYCAAGIFPEQELNELLSGVEK
jgi:outer membrane protein TolC